MLGTLTRCAVVGTVFLLGGASLAQADEYDDGEEGLDCADYISSSFNDKPLSGHLIGTEDVTETKTISAGGKVSGDAGPVSGEAGVSTVITRTSVYQVGYYQMSDGRTLEIDCRNYTVVPH